jgi:hypothetical protein
MAIDFPSPAVNGQTLTVGTTVYTYNAAKGVWNLGTNIQYIDSTNYVITPLDPMVFDGIENRFYPKSNGIVQTVLNPYTILLTIDGILQSIGFPEVVWGSPFSFIGFTVDSDGYVAFAAPPAVTSTSSGRILPIPSTQTAATTYPFKATDILLGAN